MTQKFKTQKSNNNQNRGESVNVTCVYLNCLNFVTQHQKHNASHSVAAFPGNAAVNEVFRVTITNTTRTHTPAHAHWFIERTPETKGPGSSSLMNCFCGRAKKHTQAHAPLLKLQRATLINHSDRQTVDRHGSVSLSVAIRGDERDSLGRISVTVLVLSPESQSRDSSRQHKYVWKRLNWSEKKKYHINTHALSFFFFSFFPSRCVAPLSVSSSSPLCCPYRKPQLTSRRLCFCLDLWIEFFRAPAIKYGIEIAPLFLLRQGGGVARANCLPPSLHYAACFPVSASQVLPTPCASTSVLLFRVHPDTNTQKHMITTCYMHIRVCMERRMEGGDTKVTARILFIHLLFNVNDKKDWVQTDANYYLSSLCVFYHLK